MDDITFVIETAEAVSSSMAKMANEMRQNRTLMYTKAHSIIDVWKCDAELQFQDQHEKLLIELDKKIIALEEIRKGLDSAISTAKSTDKSFGY